MIRHEQIQTLLAPPMAMTMRLMGEDSRFQPDARDREVIEFCRVKRSVMEVADRFGMTRENARLVLQPLVQFGLLDCKWRRAFEPEFDRYINKLVYWSPFQ